MDNQGFCGIIIEPLAKKLTVPKNTCILEILLTLDLTINASCGGNGICGKCQIQNLADKNSLSYITEKEQNLIPPERINQGYRLACETKIKKSSIIWLTEKMIGLKENQPKILIEFQTLKGQNFSNNFNIHENINKNTTCDPSKRLGIAFDLGTTTIIGYLLDRLSSNIIDYEAIYNPQILIGEDVISRLAYAQKSSDKFQDLRNRVLKVFNRIIDNLLAKTTFKHENIGIITVVGNTAMHHIFHNFPIESLCKAPYKPYNLDFIKNTNKEFAFSQLNSNTEIISPPVIAGFVGADTTADILAVRQDLLKQNTLLIDIGTNGELCLGCKNNGLITASVPAGPAFEGAQLECGMRGESGAIERVNIDPHTLNPKIHTIGNRKPIGICGSGIIDLVAEMLRVRIITRSGVFNKEFRDNPEYPRIQKGTTGYKYIIHSITNPASNILPSKWPLEKISKVQDIFISQKDIREIQKAKGALLAGALLLLRSKNQNPSDVEQILIAGAFGTFLNKKNAHFIGLFPEIALDSIYQIGNAAGFGAIQLLLDEKLREIASKIANNVEYLELASQPDFGLIFAHCMTFPHANLDLFPSLIKEYANIPLR